MKGRDLEVLITLAHQLKGAGGGYGFMPITDAAHELEIATRSELEVDKLSALADELTSLCQRAKAKG